MRGGPFRTGCIGEGCGGAPGKRIAVGHDDEAAREDAVGKADDLLDLPIRSPAPPLLVDGVLLHQRDALDHQVTGSRPAARRSCSSSLLFLFL